MNTFVNAPKLFLYPCIHFSVRVSRKNHIMTCLTRGTPIARSWICVCTQRWQQQYHQLGVMRKKARSFMTRLVHRSLNAAFQWFAFRTSCLKRCGVKCSTIIARTYQLSGARALQHWRVHTVEEKQMRNKALKVVYRIVNRVIVQAFERWREHTLEQRKLKAKARKVVRRFMIRTLVEGFETWSYQAVEAKKLKAKAHRVVRRIVMHSVVMGFQCWKVKIVEEKKMAAVIARVRARMTNRCVYTCFLAWAQARLTRQRLKRLVFRVTNIFLVSICQSWLDLAVTEAKRRNTMLNIWNRLQNRLLHLSLEQLKKFFTTLHRSHSLRMLGTRHSKTMLLHAFKIWLEQQHLKKLMRNRSTEFAHRGKRQALTFVMYTLCLHTLHTQRTQQANRHLSNRVIRRQKESAISCWRYAATIYRHHAATVVRQLVKNITCMQLEVFAQWSCKHYNHVKRCRLQQRLRRCTLYAVLQQLAHTSRQMKKAKQRMKQRQTFALHIQMSDGFAGWLCRTKTVNTRLHKSAMLCNRQTSLWCVCVCERVFVWVCVFIRARLCACVRVCQCDVGICTKKKKGTLLTCKYIHIH